MLPEHTERVRAKEGAFPLFLFLLAEVKARKSWCWAKHPGKRGRDSLKCASPMEPEEGKRACVLFSSFCSFRVTSLKVS